MGVPMPVRAIKEFLAQNLVITFREVAIVAVLLLAYMSTRKLILSDSYTAIINARQIIALEKDLGFFWEPTWQTWAVTHAKAAVVFLNWAYILSYGPVMLLTGVALFGFDRHGYYYYRNVMFVALSVALIVFILFPAAPPRMIPAYFVDTIQLLGPSSYGGEGMNRFVNIYAAIPSMHLSWGIIFAVICWRYGKPYLTALGVFFSILVFLSITITGNHYIADAIAGAVITGVGFAVVELAKRLRSYRPQRFQSTD